MPHSSPLMHAMSGNHSGRVLLLGFLEQGNLGIGYLSASLQKLGIRTTVRDIRSPIEDIAGVIRRENPALVGFSLIFEYFLYTLADLVKNLRFEKFEAHFTVGGHYPSLSPSAVLDAIAGIDSVVMFEGEQTLCHLVEALCAGLDWRTVKGIGFRRGTGVETTPLRPPVENLDTLPFPDRPYEPNKILGRAFMPILASRGCPRRCAFCSIQSFYGAAGGKLVRRRSPARVVDEMEHLLETRGISVFLFQDDDFPMGGAKGRSWTTAFLAELRKQALDRRVLWKISCRADDLDYWQLLEMRAHGLYLVYIGIESGNAEGLRTLNKGTSVEQNLEAAALVLRAGLQFNYGFMLFDPSSSLASIRANIDCLEKLTAGGASPVSFCKMLPYTGTPIMRLLKEAGRLTTINGQPDYRFEASEIDDLFGDVMRLSAPWLKAAPELSVTLGLLQHESVVMQRSCPSLKDIADYRLRIDAVIEESNTRLLGVLRTCLEAYETNGVIDVRPGDTLRYCRSSARRALEARDAYVRRNQRAIMADMAGCREAWQAG